jgi:hypothetical protein
MNHISADLLREIGEAMYGARWKKDLAGDLGVNERTIRRWSAGEWPVPAGTYDALRKLIDTQALAVERVKRRMRAHS